MFSQQRHSSTALGTLVAFVLVVFFHPVQAAEDAPLPIATSIDSMGIQAYGPVAVISPDGALAAISVAVVHQHELRLLSLNGSENRILGELKDDASAPSWSPDGRSLAFFSRRSGEYGLWIWQRESGQLTQVAGVSPAIFPPWHRPLWTPDSRSIVIALAAASNAAPIGQPFPPQPEAVRIFRSGRSEGPRKLPSDRPVMSKGIGIVDVRTGKLREITIGEIDSYRLNPRGTQLAVLERLPRRDVNTFEVQSRLHIIDLGTGVARVLTDFVTTTQGKLTWSPNGRYVSWVQDYAPEIGPAYLASVTDGTVRRIAADPHVTFADEFTPGKTPLWHNDSTRLFLVAGGQLWVATPAKASARRLTNTEDWLVTDLVPGVLPDSAASTDNYRSVIALVHHKDTLQEGFARVDLQNGRLSLLAADDVHFADGVNQPSMLPDGKRVLYLAQAADRPEALWLSDLDSGTRRRVAPINPHLENRAFGASRLIRWKNSRGNELRGALLLPSSYQPGRLYPLIVEVYGEPNMSRIKNYFGTEPDGSGQIYATRDYAVLHPDTLSRVGTPVADVVDDVLSGLDAAIATGIVDPKKIVVKGTSYGGYNAIGIIAHSGAFAAAASVAGFADLLTVYGNGERGTMSPGWAKKQGRMSGDPWTFRQQYLDNSPVWQLDRVKTPLLLVHGTADDTVPAYASVMVFNALASLGREVELVQYAGENHEIMMRPNRLDFHARVLAWFDEHLDLARDASGRLLFDGNQARSRKSTPSLSIEGSR